MTSILKAVSGYKTYALGALTALLGVAELVGIDILPNVDQTNALPYIIAGLGMIFGRNAIAKVAA